MAQVPERCPHCGHRGADILRSERRPGIRVIYLCCGACSGDWLSNEDIDDEMSERPPEKLEKKDFDS